MVPYEIMKADNGDAWVKVDDKKLAPPQIVIYFDDGNGY